MRQTNGAGYCPAAFADSYDNTGKIKGSEWRRSIKGTKEKAMLNDISPVRGSGPAKLTVEIRELVRMFINASFIAMVVG